MKQYEKYKPSGIEWLGEIPEHWVVKRVKNICDYISRGITPSYVELSQFKVINQGTFSKGYFDSENAKHTANSDKRALTKNNDILIASTGGGVLGKTHFIENINGSFFTDSHVTTLRVNRSHLVPKYLYYFFSINYDLINGVLAKGSTNQTELQRDQLLNFHWSFPTLPEQLSIATYLDNKTAAIDRKIELLTAKAEKYKALRRSLINQTVCRGLNPNAPLKDSGIEWIGKIPEHWEVKRLKNLCNYISRGITPDYIEESEFKVINQATFSQGLFDDKNIKFTAKSDKRAEAKADDILIASTGGGVLGKVFFIDSLSGKYYPDSHVTTIRTNSKYLKPKYLFYFLSINFELINGIMAKGSTNQTELQRDSLLGFNWCTPTIKEQAAIINYLDTKTAQIDTILANISKQIAKLTQLRKTLINEVVTGQLKVTE